MTLPKPAVLVPLWLGVTVLLFFVSSGLGFAALIVGGFFIAKHMESKISPPDDKN